MVLWMDLKSGDGLDVFFFCCVRRGDADGQVKSHFYFIKPAIINTDFGICSTLLFFENFLLLPNF